MNNERKNIDISKEALIKFRKTFPKNILLQIDNGGILLCNNHKEFQDIIEKSSYENICENIQKNPIFLRIGNIQALKILRDLLNKSTEDNNTIMYKQLMIGCGSYSSTLNLATVSFVKAISRDIGRKMLNNQINSFYEAVKSYYDDLKINNKNHENDFFDYEMFNRIRENQINRNIEKEALNDKEKQNMKKDDTINKKREVKNDI